MASYYIDSLDLHAAGFEVINVSGVEDIPGRKGETYQNWDDYDGIEPFVDVDDIILEPKAFSMELYLVTEDTATAQEQMRLLEQTLYAQGNRTVKIDYYTDSILCYCPKGFKTDRVTKAVGDKIAYKIKIDFIMAAA